jgi:hexulose-6-phosphate isomerase
MGPIDRRGFLKTAGALGAAAAISAPAVEAGGRVRWRKAFMLGGASKGPVREHFLRLRDAGFEGVELVSPNELDRDEVLKARDEAGLIIHGVSGSRHWRDTLSDPDPAVRFRGVEAILKEIEDCRAYGGTTVLVVPAVVTKNVSHREAYTNSHMMFTNFIPAAKEAGVKIAIEEVWNKFLLSAPEFVKYVDSFQSPYVGAYFDVGNVVEYGFPQEWIRELGHRILKVHIKEYGKARRFNYPLGEGEIDWPAVTQALIDVGYDGWITAEVPYGDLDALKDVVRRMDKILTVTDAGPSPRAKEEAAAKKA